MERVFCKDCRHFRQHYVLDEHQATAVNCGHCVEQRRKHRAAAAVACSRFERGERPLPDRRVVMHFLTTTMLEYILALQLPPEVEGR